MKYDPDFAIRGLHFDTCKVPCHGLMLDRVKSLSRTLRTEQVYQYLISVNHRKPA